ncbi:MAG: diaminopimelate decarboxylase [Aggregatilineales bacterium]
MPRAAIHPMPFEYVDSQLYCEQVSLEALADTVGTPCYIYSLDRARANYRRLATAFAPLGASIHYSLKANANLALVRALLAEGTGLDAVSGGEIYRALAAGAAPHRIVFAGVGKTADELAYALDQRIGCFNVESAQELERLNALAASRDVRPIVALRLNPDVQADTHRYIATGHAAAKFGIGETEARVILTAPDRYPALTIEGLHVHIGSQLETTAGTGKAIGHAIRLIDEFPYLTRLNVGGGFPVAYNDETYPPIEAFAAEIAQTVGGRALQLSIEPGRYIVADAGALLVTVQYVKHVGTSRIIVTDGGMTELIRPALYGARHPIRAVKRGTEVTEAQVVGPICESADVLHPAALLPEVQPGDRLAVMMAGAYGATMGSTYNGRPRPPEVVIENYGWRVARRRESWADLIRLEAEG